LASTNQEGNAGKAAKQEINQMQIKHNPTKHDEYNQN